jgi:hypothetical protein
MGSEQTAISEKKRILHIAGGMIGGNIESFKIVIIGFYLRASGDGITQTHKNLSNLIDGAIEGMDTTQGTINAWHGDIEGFSG